MHTVYRPKLKFITEKNYLLQMEYKVCKRTYLCIYTVSQKKGTFLFLLELDQISTNLINFGKKMAKRLKFYTTYTFSTSPNLCNRTTLLNTDVQNCYITLEFITIRLLVQYPSVERPPYSEEGSAAQVPKEDQCPRTNSS